MVKYELDFQELMAQVLDYVANDDNYQSDQKGYLKELAKVKTDNCKQLIETGAFYDAMGKPVKIDKEFVYCETEY